jgi:hypothetical protein
MEKALAQPLLDRVDDGLKARVRCTIEASFADMGWRFPYVILE